MKGSSGTTFPVSPLDVSADTCADPGRRSLLRSVFLGLGVGGLPAWFTKDVFAAGGGPELDLPLGPLAAQDYGPLEQKVVVDDLTLVNHQLFAPAGFEVRLVSRAGLNPVSKTATGTLAHVNPDGGAVFVSPTDGGWVYASNSETTPGGVGAIRFDASGNIVDYYRILAGTRNNCAGGETPWGTWLSCEETTGGYVFECQPFGDSTQAVRLDALGPRNGREAVAIDPINNVAYQTLDSGNQPFVRFISNPDDLVAMPNGVTRMRMVSGVSQRLHIPAFNGLPGYVGTGITNDATNSANLRQARPIQWVDDVAGTATLFNGGEGIWYYEIPEALRTTPAAGTVPSRGIMFFATKNDNRIWAIDIANNLIELIYDTQNNQAFPNLRPAGVNSNFNQVDNVVVSPKGDVLVAEDGTNMRLAIMVNNQPGKLLMQITRGGSEICGPAFHPDGTRLYFSSQRGPSGAAGTGSSGTTYEMTIPPRFRAIQRCNAFTIPVVRAVNPGAMATSEPVTLQGFLGPLMISREQLNGAQISVNNGSWQDGPLSIEAGQSFRIRHVAGSTPGAMRNTMVTVGLPSGVANTTANFQSVTTSAKAAFVPT